VNQQPAGRRAPKLVWVVVRRGVGDMAEIRFSVEVKVRFGSQIRIKVGCGYAC